MVHVLAFITTKPGLRADVLAAFNANVPAVHAEDGCIEYGATVDMDDAGPIQTAVGADSFVVVEKWQSLDHLKAHAASPHMAAYGAKVKDMLADRTDSCDATRLTCPERRELPMSVRTLIKAPPLFDATSEQCAPHAFVVLDGEQISALGSQRDLGVNAHEQFDRVVDLPADSTLLPGLINMHTHLSFSSSMQVFTDATTDSDPVKMIRIVENMRKCLHTGVTTVRDCGTRPHLALPVRDAVEQGLLPGPRIIASGAITSTGGHCWFCATEADSEAEIRKAVRTHVKDGVDFIKLFATGGNTTPGSNALVAQYTEAEMCAATEEARKASRRTAAHAHGIDGVRHSIAARVTTIEHCSFQTKAGIGWDEALASEALDAGIYVCHTVFRGISKLEHDNTHVLTDSEAQVIEKRRQSTADGLALTRRLADKGVQLLAGNDAGVMHVDFADFPGDLVMTSEGCGLSPCAVLQSATSIAAQALGREDIGTIAAGKVADLLVVNGDPIHNIRDIERTAMVFTRGERVVNNPTTS